MIFGNPTVGGSTQELAANEKRVSRFTLSHDVHVPKLSAYLDGGGSGVGTGQAIKAVIYAADNSLVGTSSEVTVLDGQAAGWVDFIFHEVETQEEGLVLAAGDYDLGLISSATANITRIYYASGGTGRYNADTYSDGPADPFGSPTATTQSLSVYATAFFAFAPSTNVEDDYLASLGFQEAQAVLGAGSPLIRTDLAVNVGWHGTRVDPQRGSYGIAQRDGALTDYVGERVKVTYDERSVVVYVTDEKDIEQDLSLSRRAFLALAPLSDGELEAVVEIMAADE